MWQRLQSVFLVISILALLFAFIYPVWSGGNDIIQYRLYPVYFMVKENGAITVSQYIPYCITAILMAAAITISITEFRRYDNLLLQVKLGTLNALILTGIIVCDMIFSNKLAKSYAVPWQYDLGIFLALTALLCNWIAIRFIRRDQKILKDSDRIR